MDAIVVSVIRNNVIDRVTVFQKDENKKAEDHFLCECSQVLSNWEEYTQDDKDAILDNGVETFGCGSICITRAE